MFFHELSVKTQSWEQHGQTLSTNITLIQVTESDICTQDSFVLLGEMVEIEQSHQKTGEVTERSEGPLKMNIAWGPSLMNVF